VIVVDVVVVEAILGMVRKDNPIEMGVNRRILTRS